MTTHPKKFLLIGDSLTQFALGTPRIFNTTTATAAAEVETRGLVLSESCGGPGFGDALSEIYSRRCDVICRGFAGYNTNYFIRYGFGGIPSEEKPISSDAKRAKTTTRSASSFAVLADLDDQVAAIFLCFGANDASDKVKNLFNQHVDVEDFEANMRYIIATLRERCPSAKILVSPPTPVHREKYLEWRGSPILFPANEGKSPDEIIDRSTDRVRLYAEAVRRVVRSMNDDHLALCDLFETFMTEVEGKEDNLGSLLSDGLHFNERGEEVVLTTILATIAERFPELKVVRDPITNSFSNSGSKCKALEIRPACWDALSSTSSSSSTVSNVVKPFIRAASSRTSRPYFLLIGDSITQQSVGHPNFKADGLPGWGDVLNAKYNRRADVINRGLSGYNSRWTAEADISIPSSSSKAGDECLLVTIFLGANDACLRSKQFVGLEEYESNLETLIKRTKATFSVGSSSEFNRIVVIAPPPVAERRYLKSRKERPMNAGKSDEEIMDRSNSVVVEYSIRARRVADKYNLPFLDSFSILGGHRGKEEELERHLFDGLHLSGMGSRILITELMRIVDEKFGEQLALVPDRLLGTYQGPNSIPGELIAQSNLWIQTAFRRYDEVAREVKDIVLLASQSSVR